MGFPISLAVAVLVPELLGSLVGQATRDDLTGWFTTLRKPSWEPPGALFGIAWTVFYSVMGVASWRVWVQGGWQVNQRALTLYLVQLVLNLAWPLVFFNMKRLGAALALNLGVLAAAAATASAFYKVDHLAGQLLLPYLAWLAFANALNLSVLQKNPDAQGSPSGGGGGPTGTYTRPRPTRASLHSGDALHASHPRSRAPSVRVHCAQQLQAAQPCCMGAGRPAAAAAVAARVRRVGGAAAARAGAVRVCGRVPAPVGAARGPCAPLLG